MMESRPSASRGRDPNTFILKSAESLPMIWRTSSSLRLMLSLFPTCVMLEFRVQPSRQVARTRGSGSCTADLTTVNASPRYMNSKYHKQKEEKKLHTAIMLSAGAKQALSSKFTYPMHGHRPKEIVKSSVLARRKLPDRRKNTS